MSPGAVFDLYFGVPAGAVWSNLIASLICVGVAWWRLHRQSARQHVEALAQAARHHAERLAQAETHHQALKAHITAAAAAPASGTAGEVAVNVVTNLSPQEFEKQLRLLMRRNPGEFEKMLGQVQRRHGGNFPLASA